MAAGVEGSWKLQWISRLLAANGSPQKLAGLPASTNRAAYLVRHGGGTLQTLPSQTVCDRIPFSAGSGCGRAVGELGWF